MKKVTTRVIYTPKSVPPVEPDFKAVLIDNEKFVLTNYKAYTYSPGDFSSGDDAAVQLHNNFNTDIDELVVSTKTTATSIPVIIHDASHPNPGIYKAGEALMMCEWALGSKAAVEDLTVGSGGVLSGFSFEPTKKYYLVTGINGAADSTTTPEFESEFDESPDYSNVKMAAVTKDGDIWKVSIEDLPAGTYEDVYIYEDIYDIITDKTPVSAYLTVDGDYLVSNRKNTLIEITNYADIVDIYGAAAVAKRGNIAYSAAMFYMWSGGRKTFYIAPMQEGDDVSELIDEMTIKDDAYFLIYNRGDYKHGAHQGEISSLKNHAKVMSGPLYKRERRVYCKSNITGTTADMVSVECNKAILSALPLDDHRVSIIANIADTDSFIKYCGYRYRVPVNYSLTNQKMDIGNIWPQVSKVSEEIKESMKDNGVVMFDQKNPMSTPFVMYQTTTYIEHDVLAKKEEDIQISIDEVCRVIRQVLEPRIARGYDNKVTADPLHPISVAFVKNLNADISAVRTEYVTNREIFGEILVIGVEIDKNDPRQTRLLLRLRPYYNVNRIDIYIYI